jgi:catechol 2,3-dioxygenase-like lactoylglutathione lyase family enzyme
MRAEPTVDELAIADAPAAWRAAGFDVDGEVCAVGTVRLRLEGPGRGRGIVAWSLRDVATVALDGLPTTVSTRPPPAGGEHPNGVLAIDHLVAMTPDLDRTTAILREAGMDFRRLREEPTPGGAPRQAFFRLGEVILELVQAPEGTKIASDRSGPARLWGISFGVRDLDATAATLGDLLGTVRDAVQPGRRIGTLRREAGLGPAIAFMSRAPDAQASGSA